MKKKNLIRKGLILDPEHPGYKNATWTITFGPGLSFKKQTDKNEVSKEEFKEGDVLQFCIPPKKQKKSSE